MLVSFNEKTVTRLIIEEIGKLSIPNDSDTVGPGCGCPDLIDSEDNTLNPASEPCVDLPRFPGRSVRITIKR